MKKAVLTLTNRDPKGAPIGDLVLTMEFVKTLPDPQQSLYSFAFALEGQMLQFKLIRVDADNFFRLFGPIMAQNPVEPGTATYFHSADSDGNPNGSIGIKLAFYDYTDPSGKTTRYYPCSFLPDNDVELGFLLGTNDADVFFYDFDNFLETNPPSLK